MSMENWMSIDFGTSSSVAVILRDGGLELVTPLMADAAGSKIFPTIAYVGSGHIYACHEAEQLYIHDPVHFIREFKLEMRNQMVPFLDVTYKEIVVGILKTLKDAAERQLQDTVNQVVLTVPAIYNELDVRQKIMQEAAVDAGFEKIELLKEAQAAALYYDYLEQSGNQQESISLVYDLGGGTFDPALIRHTAGGYSLMESESVGIPVGGKFFTERIILDYVRKTGIKLDMNPGDSGTLKQMLALRAKCESIKRYLSYKDEGIFPIEDADQEYRLTRDDFEKMISGMIDRTLGTCDTLLQKNKLPWTDISRVLLIGGSCHIPLVRKKIRSFLDANNASACRIVWGMTETKKTADPQFAVALGGAVLAKRLSVPKRPTLGYIEYGEQGMLRTFSFPGEGEFVLGRWVEGVDIDIPIRFAEGEKRLISRKHLKFVVQYDSATNKYIYSVEDLKSTNGTYVNNQRLVTRIQLENGDVIRAGRHLFTLNV